MRLLIVDSDIPLILKLKKAFEELGHEVRAVGRPKAALTALKESVYDVAIVDLYIERTDVIELIQKFREIQPKLPIVISGRYEDDVEKTNVLAVQGYVHKPYAARKLVPFLEKAIQKLHGQASANDPASRLDHLLEMALAQATTDEPSPDEKEATIGQVVSALYDLEIEADSHEQFQATDTPPLPKTVVIPTTSSEDTSGIPATSALQISNDENALDDFLVKIENWAKQTGRPPLKPLPSWNTPLTAEERAQFEGILDHIQPPNLPEPIPDDLFDHALQPPPVSMESRQFIYEPHPTTDATTRPFPSSTIDLEPDPLTPEEIARQQRPIDPQLLDALADSANNHDSQLRALLDAKRNQSSHLDDGELVPMSVEEITQALAAINPEDMPSSPPLTYEKQFIADATLELIDLALESTALGIFLLHHTTAVTQRGDLPNETWEEVTTEVLLAWEREGDSSTRLLYRNVVGIGESLIFSTRTIDNLTLTMIFAADTPLRIIRRQATRLIEALAAVPDISVDEGPTASPYVDAPPAIEDVVTENEDVIPEAAQTLPSRPTDPVPPKGLKEAIKEQGIKDRTSSDYIHYACLWLRQEARLSLTEEMDTAFRNGLALALDNVDGEITAIDIGKMWINLHVVLPVKAVPSEIIPALMHETNTILQELQGRNPDAYPSIWSHSYSISTPGRLFSPKEIERFIRFVMPRSA